MTPFSGPRGDYKGAARKAEFANSQQAFYSGYVKDHGIKVSGYVKDHGIKVETIFMPNSLSTLFGPVLARRADAGVLAMSNLNEFLVKSQRGCFFTEAGEEVYYCGFGDGTFNLGLQCLQSYYREFNRGAELDDARARCNAAMRSARIAIEKNYGMVSSLFRICCTKESNKLAKKNPVAIEQLRVCHLLTNCYVCLNGDQAGSMNTFGITPPRLEDYLAL